MGLVELARADASEGTDTVAPPGLAAGRSAEEILDRRQRGVIVAACLVLAALLLAAPLATVIGIMTIATIVYFSTVCHRIALVKRSLRGVDLVRVTDEEARSIPDHCLPVYTVLVPAYHEAHVVETLVAHLRALEYPRDRLDLKLLLEADDYETVAAAQRFGADLEIVLVPPGGPRTKPKALNCGLQTAHGEYITIYDAEDIPDPLQLRRAVVAFQRLPPEVACLQAQLNFHDWDSNIITRWFTIEYLMWFSLFLPGLSSTDAPVPLGGTSNHIRRDVLESIGAWDAYNVTEDADLGVRLHAQRWRTAVLDSTTYEEPNNDFVNWVKQRSRWYKGYLQTWLVNLRHPIELWRELGTGGFAQFNLFVGGTPVLALINPIFWLLTLVWFTGHAAVIQAIFPAPLYHLALFCWIVGNLAVLYVTILAARRSGRNSLVWAACLVPVYWVMMAMAAVKAFWQVLAAPSFWEKTTHGLTGSGTMPPPAVVITPAPAPIPVAPRQFTPPISWPAPPPTAETSVAGNGAGGASDPNDPHAPDHGPDGPGSSPPPTAPTRRARRIDPRAWLEIGRTLRAVGLVIVLFLGYLVVGTAWRADAAQGQLRHDLAAATPGRVLHVGDPVGRLRAPRRGIDAVVVEGTGTAQLDRGPGHVRGSANPGARGNVVIVGHRVVAGAPFAHLDRLRPGDQVELQAPWGRARYRVAAVGTRSADGIDLSSRGTGRLTLVTSGGGLDPSQRLVVTGRLTSRPARGAPAHAPTKPTLPGADLATIPLLAAAAFATGLAWRARRWIVPLAGRWRGTLIVAPFLAVGLYEVFTTAARLLPPTL